MKNIFIHIIFILIPGIVCSQIFIDSQSSFHVDQNAVFFAPQDITNQGLINNLGTIQINGNWTNNGTNAPQGTVIFQGTNQQIIQNGNTFYNLVITGGGDKEAPSRMYITNNLQLDDGYLVPIDTAKIILLENATSTIGSNASFVKGTLFIKGTGSKYYPIGMNSLFLPAEFHVLTGNNPIIGISTHEFTTTPEAGKGTNAVFNNAYWKVEVLDGSYTDAKISLMVVPEITTNLDSIVVVQAPSVDVPFESIGNDPTITSIIPGDYVSSKDTAKGPIFGLGVLLDVNWDLLYIPNALTKNSPNAEERCVKVYGELFKAEGFSFKVTNQWGNVVFETTSLSEMENTGWTGENPKTKRRESIGQYFYYINAVAKDKTPYSKAGSLWIID